MNKVLISIILILISHSCLGYYKLGKPYQVNGKWYHPTDKLNYSKTGLASWYGEPFHGKPTANGEIFDKNKISAAHTELALPCVVTVTNLENGKKLKVRVNDRGPFGPFESGPRIIDLSEKAAWRLGMHEKGTARVKIVLDKKATIQARKAAGEKTPIKKGKKNKKVSKKKVRARAKC